MHPVAIPVSWTGIIRTRRGVDGAATLKIDRHGRAKILSLQEIQLLFSQGVDSLRDKALFAVMLYTACRVNEAVTLLKRDVYDTKGKVRAKIIFRKGNTKGKLATRAIPVIQEDELYKYLEVREDQVLGAVSSLALLAPVDEDDFGKPNFVEVTDNSVHESS
ncbi:site-specific integrase [Nostoc sp. CHAB 5834]|nr:site-specific integrase [Nostoc sp. CHAB 5834]